MILLHKLLLKHILFSHFTCSGTPAAAAAASVHVPAAGSSAAAASLLL